METLMLMRHAKSDWSDDGLRDLERPLNERGERDAPRMGRLLRAEGWWPELVLASPAVRTRETAAGLFAGAEMQCEIQYLPDFYPGGPAAFRTAFAALDEECRSALFLAHNPGIEEFVMELTGEHHRMPTASIAVFHLPEGTLEEAVLIGLYRPAEA